MTGNINDRRADVGATADNEQSLGAALGRALGAQVDAAAMPALLPPGVMADRARARARMRTARRAVVAVAASVSVVFGSVVGWNALSRGATTTVFVTSADPSAPSQGTVPRAGPETPAPTLIEKDDGSQLTAPGPTPEDLSTGPVLEWTEIDPGFHELFGFKSAGDGRVIASAWPEGVEQVLWGETVVVTENGTNWEELPLPEGLIPEELDVAGDRWLVIGRYHNFDAPEGRLDRVFFSDDEGATWTELELEVPPDPALAFPYLQEHVWVTPALVSGERMVLVLQGYTSVDADSLLADAGLISEDREVVGWRDQASGAVVFDLSYPVEADPESSDFEPQHVEVTLEQLGLTAEEWTALNGPHEDVIRILYSDGAAVEYVARFTGWIPTGIATDDGFALTLLDGLDGSNETILTSSDGRVWTERQSLEYGYSHRIIEADGTSWNTAPEPLGSMSVQRAGYLEAPTTVTTFAGLHPTGTLAAGPAGVAATAFPSVDGQLEAGSIGGLPVWRDPDRVSEPTGVPLWVGWSADGTDWGWQSLPDAFGITEGESSAQLAVGRDFVIARVETFTVPAPSEIAATQAGPSERAEPPATEAPAARWFIARVP